MNSSGLNNINQQDEEMKSKIISELQRSNFSSLSDCVRDLLQVSGISSPISENQLKQTIDPDTVGKLLEVEISQSPVSKTDINYYKCIVSQIAPMLRAINSELHNICPDDYVQLNMGNLEWLCISSTEIVSCLQDAQSEKCGILYCACLRLTSILERSLQDLHWSNEGSTPIVLKDLLASKTLLRLLGEDAMIFFDILIGPPTSLNIRNLVWHGFGSATDKPEQYALIIFFTCVLIGRILKTKNVTVYHREYLKIDSSMIENSAAIAYDMDLTHEFSALMATISVKSQEIHQAISYASEGRYGLATMLLVTSFEQLMRVAFCIYNDCPSRLMTAVNSEYFTTLDHVFEEYLTDKVTANVLHRLLPDRLRTAIFDLLYYPHGLRLRDRLSHMEISYLDIPKEVWSYTFSILSSTILHTIFNGSATDAHNYMVEHYTPVYHPLSLVRNRVVQLGKEILLIKEMSAPANLEYQLLDNTQFNTICQNFLLHFQQDTSTVLISVDELLFPLVQRTSRRKLSISSSFNATAEWCRWLHTICSNLLNTSKIISIFNQSRQAMQERKMLRSRQRKNYAAFFSNKSCLSQLLETLYTLTKVFMNMMAATENSCAILKSHKALLQLSENLHSLADQNKWSNLLAYFVTFVNSNLS